MQYDRIKECTVKFKACVWLNSLSPPCVKLYSLTHVLFTPFVLMMLTVALVTIPVRLQLCSCCYFYCNNIINYVRHIIIIIISVITVMQGICNYVPETNHVSRVYSVAAVL